MTSAPSTVGTFTAAIIGWGAKALFGTTVAANNAAQNNAIDPRFATHYEKYIRPLLRVFEQRRVDALLSARTNALYSLAFLALAGAGFIYYQAHFRPDLAGSLFKGFIALCLIAVGVISWPVFRYASGIKHEIFPRVFYYFGPQWQYEPEGLGKKIGTIGSIGGLYAPQLETYAPFGILPPYTTSKTTDHLQGTYKDVGIDLLQCVLSKQTKTKDTIVETEQFRGLLITLNVPKRFTGHTIIVRDQGSLGNWLEATFASGNLHRVALEDPRFEKRYEVYGTDQIEARYLLPPSFMERLVALEDLFTTSPYTPCAIQCAFKDGKLMFMLPTAKEWFATGSVFQTSDFIPEINLILQEMDQLFAIIDTLKLDDTTGL